MAKKSAASSHALNAIELLKADHDEVLKLFSKFEKMDKEDNESKRDLVENACTQLTIHAEIEEELFYPAMRDVLDDMSLLDEAQVEHDMARQLIDELESMEPDEDLYDAKFTVLGEYVKHHIEEEQKEMFPKAKKAQIDLDTLGADLHDRKQELMQEYGLEIEEEAADLEGFIEPKSDKKPARHPRA